MRKTAFNLVEILVAMAILTIGMVGLVGIIPVSTEALGSANGKLYAAEIGQFMSDYVSADCDGLTNPYVGASPADTPPKLGLLPTAYATTPVNNGTILTRTSIANHGQALALSKNTEGIYIVDHSSIIGTSTLVDFKAFINITYTAATRTAEIDVNWPANTKTDTPAANRAAGRCLTFYRVIQP